MAKEISESLFPVRRDSASLIICVKTAEKMLGFNYKLLMLKRSDHTAFIKDQTVFPGGLYDHSDGAIEWLKYFQEFGVTEKMLEKLLGAASYDKIFKATNTLSRELSFRINALRETFEEVGVFFCRNRKQLLTKNRGAFYKDTCDYDQSYWQAVVHNDPQQFLRMCRELKVVPDFWSLHRWSCWASPAVLSRGYETVFFITFLQEVPVLLPEKSEVKECLWLSPTQCLQMHRKRELYLSSPQFYETTRLMCEGSFDKLRKCAQERCKGGDAFYLPILYLCDDGIVSVLPGDDFYIGNARTSTDLRPTNSTIVQFRLKCKRIHRIENVGSPDMAVRLNFKLDDRLISNEDELANKAKL